MNLAKLMKSARADLGQHAVAVFGEKSSGDYLWGTGILVDLRGMPLVLTCAHVLDPIVGVPYLSAGRSSYQEDAVHLYRFSNTKLDAACLVLRDPQKHLGGAGKAFIPASSVQQQPIQFDDEAYVHGFPVGHPKLQEGGKIDVAARTARFTSMTYFTLATTNAHNQSLGFMQPRVEWNLGRNVDAKRFSLLPKDLTPTQRGGFSGGPVVSSSGGAPSRLCGQITHASDYSLFYNPITTVLDWIDKTL